MFLIIQKGHALFGQGETKEQAIKDANEWLPENASGEWTEEDFNPSYHQANEGDLCIVQLDNETQSYLQQ